MQRTMNYEKITSANPLEKVDAKIHTLIKKSALE